MDWTVTVTADTEAKGVCTVAASAAGCAHARRVDTNRPDDVGAYIAEAREMAAAAEKRAGETAELAAMIKAKLEG